MTTNQIYELCNSIARQTTGRVDLVVTNTNQLVALGETILSSSEYTEAFTELLIQRIGKTIIVNRMYENNLAPIMMDDMTWGGIVQKIDVEMPELIEDEAWDLTDGQSVDMYIVRKPKIRQHFFAKRTPYSAMITVWKKNLREAFLSETAMGSFISAMFTQVRNKLELTIENLSRLTMANYMAISSASQKMHLLTMWNNIPGNTSINNPEQALYSNEFLRFMIGQMNLASLNLKTLSVKYNGAGVDRFTPEKRQMYVTTNLFEVNMQTQVQYAAYHESLVNKAASFSVPYWQASDDPMSIHLNAQTKDGISEIKLENIVAFIFDREALGTFRRNTDIATTPLNARGLYTNTFWHEEQLWFNDISENGLIFMLD